MQTCMFLHMRGLVESVLRRNNFPTASFFEAAVMTLKHLVLMSFLSSGFFYTDVTRK